MNSKSGAVAEVSIRQLIFLIYASCTIYLVAVFHPYSRAVDLSSPLPLAAIHAWLLFQGALLCLPGWVLGSLLSSISPRLGYWVGYLLISAAPALVIADVFIFNFISERFLSETSRKVLVDLIPSLLLNLNAKMIKTWIIAMACVVAWFVFGLLTSRPIARRILNDPRPSPRFQIAALVLGYVIASTVLPALRYNETLTWMQDISDRQPIFATGLIAHHGRGLPEPIGKEKILSSVRALGVIDRIRDKEERYKQLQSSYSKGDQKDVLFVVIESLRAETINPKAAPHMHSFAQKGMWCRNHFTTCNSTNMAMFSMLFGLESVWFETANNWEPALLKLLSNAGYRTAFFGGSRAWDVFNMDKYISPKRFDIYVDTEVEWLKTDEEMCRLTEDFFSRKGETPEDANKPHFVMLYLYSTHFDYHDAEQDRVHLPTVDGELDGNFGESEKPKIWNRYLNSVRSVDRLLAPLLKEDRVVVITGDHGEAFLEDGCRLHGVKISSYQNATPAILAGPGIPIKQPSFVTTHTDLAPTILDAVGIEPSDHSVLEGKSLIQFDGEPIRQMVTRNYLRSELAILDSEGPSENDNALLGHRCYFSMTQREAFSANPIDRCGNQWGGNDPAVLAETEELFTRWLRERFGESAAQKPTNVAQSVIPYLQTENEETLRHAVTLAANVDTADIHLVLPYVSSICKHPNEDIRDAAIHTLISLQKRSS